MTSRRKQPSGGQVTDPAREFFLDADTHAPPRKRPVLLVSSLVGFFLWVSFLIWLAAQQN